MDFSKLVSARYACKKFDGKKLPQGKVDELFELIRLAPSSFNLQPWKILVITDQKLKEKLQTVSWGQPQVGSCSHLLVFCADTNLQDVAANVVTSMSKAGVPKDKVDGYALMCANYFASLDEKSRLAWTQRQVYFAVANALLGAKALGFDSCPMEGFDAKQYSTLLKLPVNLVPTTVVPIGFAADAPRPKIRLPKDYIFIVKP